MLAPLLEALLGRLIRPNPVPAPCPVASDDDKRKGHKSKRPD